VGIYDELGNFQGVNQGSGTSFNTPEGITVNNGAWYVAEQGAQQIDKFNTCAVNGAPIGSPTVAGNTPTISSTPTFTVTPTLTPSLISCAPVQTWTAPLPYGIALDSSNNVYVADNGNNQIDIYDAFGNFINSVAGSGANQLLGPTGVAVDSANNIYVIDGDNDRVEVFDQTSHLKAQWGARGSGNSQFQSPWGIAVNAAATTVYVADWGNDRVEAFDTTGHYLTQWGATGFGGNGNFESPDGIAIDKNGYVYVADYDAQLIQVFNGQGVFQSQWSTANGLNGAGFVAIDNVTNIVYVSDGVGAVAAYDELGNLQGISYGSGTPFVNPEGLAAFNGVWYVAEQGNQVIDRFAVCTVNGNSIGSPTFTGTVTPTPTITNTPSPTSTPTNIPTSTNTATNTSTSTSTNTGTNTSTNTVTNTPTDTATNTVTNTATNTLTVTSTNTPTNTSTDTPTSTNTNTATNSPTNTQTNTSTNTATGTVTNTSTNTSSVTSTNSSTNTVTNTPTNTATNTATQTASNTATVTSTATFTNTATNTSTNTSTATFTKTATNTCTNTATSTFTNTPTNTPSTAYFVSGNVSPACAAAGASVGVTFVLQDSGTYNTLHYAIAFSTSNTPSSSASWMVGGNGAGNCPAGGAQISTGSTGLVTVGNAVIVPSGFTSGYIIIEAQTNVGSLGCGTNSGGTSDAVTVIAFGNCTATPTRTYTLTNSPTNTYTATNTPTKTYTFTSTATSTNTNTYTMTNTPTITSTFTQTYTPTLTATYTPTPTQTYTPTLTTTLTPTGTFTNTPVANACSNFTDWSAASVSYSVGTTVVYGVEMYKCIQAHTSNSGWTPPGTATLWQDVGGCTGPTSTPGPLNCSNAPAWSSSSVNYALGDQVIYNASLYQCIQAHTSNTAWTPAAEPTLWQNQGRCSGGSGSAVGIAIQQTTKTITATPSATETATTTNTITVMPTNTGKLLQSVAAAPNLSRNGSPINFHVKLGKASQVNLALFTVLGEEVYRTSVQGNAGDNQILWTLKNKAQNAVGSGIYICVIQVVSGYETVTQTTKVIVFH